LKLCSRCWRKIINKNWPMFVEVTPCQSWRISLNHRVVSSIVIVVIIIINVLHYCLLFDIGAERIKLLKYIQNAATRLVLGTWKFHHITSVLQNLHCLPVAKRITYKMVMLVHKCLNRRLMSYLADVYIPVDTLPGRQQLRSAFAGQLLVPRTSTNISRRACHYCGPATWNALPVCSRTDNRSSDAIGIALKRHLFNIGCRLLLFVLQRLLMWRIINALIIIITIITTTSVSFFYASVKRVWQTLDADIMFSTFLFVLVLSNWCTQSLCNSWASCFTNCHVFVLVFSL